MSCRSQMKIQLLGGTLHELPADMQAALSSLPEVCVKRNALTPLARNEWICRVTIVKKQETRDAHIVRLCEDVGKGKKRPCCWPGCPHHRESAKKWFHGMEGQSCDTKDS